MGRKARVKPVEGRLPILEIVKIDPPVFFSPHSLYLCRGAPVGLLDPGLIKDNPGELSHDIPLLLQHLHLPGRKVCRVGSRGDLREEAPIFRPYHHHVVNAGIVTEIPLCKAEIGSLSRVPRYDIADNDGIVLPGHLDHFQVIDVRPEHGGHVIADAVKAPVNGGSELLPREPSGPFRGTCMNGPDPDLPEAIP